MSKPKKTGSDSGPHPLTQDFGTMVTPEVYQAPAKPSPEILATIAAALAGGRAVDEKLAVKLVAEASHLWDAASEAHLRRQPKTVTQKVIEARRKEVATLHAEIGVTSIDPNSTILTEGTDRWPKSFPATLPDFFRLILRQRTEANNMALFREFLDYYCRRLDSTDRLVSLEKTEKPSVNKIVRLIESFKRDGFRKDEWDFFGKLFLEFNALKLSARGRNAAAARHKKGAKKVLNGKPDKM